MPEKEVTVDELVADLESRGLGWDLSHCSNGLIEARIWHWPFVVARYRPDEMMPLAGLLAHAMYQVDFEYYTVLGPGEEIKPYYRDHE
jgi:hypothetical protein